MVFCRRKKRTCWVYEVEGEGKEGGGRKGGRKGTEGGR